MPFRRIQLGKQRWPTTKAPQGQDDVKVRVHRAHRAHTRPIQELLDGLRRLRSTRMKVDNYIQVRTCC